MGKDDRVLGERERERWSDLWAFGDRGQVQGVLEMARWGGFAIGTCKRVPHL